MLGNANATATISVSDMDRAKKYYTETLGLSVDKESDGGLLLKSGESYVFVYQSEYAGTNKATALGWTVDDVEAAVAGLKEKGITFEQYDMPGMTREGDIHIADKFKAAWFKDPDGNILNIANNEM